MPTPALDDMPDTDAYTDNMINAYNYILKGSSQYGMIPMSEIYAYWAMFEDQIVEEKNDFVFLIHYMNQANIEHIQEELERNKQR